MSRPPRDYIDVLASCVALYYVLRQSITEDVNTRVNMAVYRYAREQAERVALWHARNALRWYARAESAQRLYDAERNVTV